MISRSRAPAATGAMRFITGAPAVSSRSIASPSLRSGPLLVAGFEASTGPFAASADPLPLVLPLVVPVAAGATTEPAAADGAESPVPLGADEGVDAAGDRKSTRLNSSHVKISYAVFCLKIKIFASNGAILWVAVRVNAT